jgi:hypothetical protein
MRRLTRLAETEWKAGASMDAAKCAPTGDASGAFWIPMLNPCACKIGVGFLVMHRDCRRPGTLERRREQLVRAHNRDVDRT